ncbi:9837_t:CDS:2 [Acaulospora morrowiae]|uniref:Glutathione peroxidase n=1 Tax=Acaulospora morrowiae TaxID=94023 RepID=A0A9N8VRF0_9GLOM|nr:9837_t:CDS:2 [Acaulospora morrowiae]
MTFYDIEVLNIEKEPVKLSQYKGKILLIVNVASKCGFTSQYNNLGSLQEKYSKKNLVVLGFPCNQFGSQEPGTEQEIKSFACEYTKRSEPPFPLFAKVEVNGENASDLYKFLKDSDIKRVNKNKIPEENESAKFEIKWNFEKFLVVDGKVIHRYHSNELPDENNPNDPLIKAL